MAVTMEVSTYVAPSRWMLLYVGPLPVLVFRSLVILMN